MVLMIQAVIGVLAGWTGSYGWAILLVTLLMRVVLLPVSLWQQRAGAKSQALSKQVQEIQERYKGEEAQRRIQELYGQSGGALFAGCLPMLVQWPIYIGVFQAMSHLVFVAPAGFLWVADLSVPDPTFLLPVAAILFSLWQSLVSLPAKQRWMAILMPAIFATFLFKATAAMALYWAAGSLIGLVQHYVMRRWALIAV